MSDNLYTLAGPSEDKEDDLPAFEIVRPGKLEHIRIYANGVVTFEDLPPERQGLPSEIAIINRIPTLLRYARFQGKYG